MQIGDFRNELLAIHTEGGPWFHANQRVQWKQLVPAVFFSPIPTQSLVDLQPPRVTGYYITQHSLESLLFCLQTE